MKEPINANNWVEKSDEDQGDSIVDLRPHVECSYASMWLNFPQKDTLNSFRTFSIARMIRRSESVGSVSVAVQCKPNFVEQTVNGLALTIR